MAIDTAADPLTPFFPSDSAMRRIHEEGILILGGGRALLMQIAHPAVARGVAEHSSYRDDRIGRLLRTLRSTFAIVFGTRPQAEAAAARINRLHEQVNGEGYDALDPELLVWVLATLADTTIEMHERFLAPVSPARSAAYYEDIVVIGGLLRIPEGRMPARLEALRSYVREMSDALAVSDDARAIARDLFAPLPGTGPAMAVARQLTAGLLHPALRERYGLGWGPARERELRMLQQTCRVILPHLPVALRRTPSFLLPERA